MFENPRRGRQARNFGKNVPKILDLKSFSEQIFSENCRWVPLPNTETAVTNGKKVAVLKTNIPLLNRNNIFMLVFPNQGASMLRVR